MRPSVLSLVPVHQPRKSLHEGGTQLAWARFTERVDELAPQAGGNWLVAMPNCVGAVSLGITVKKRPRITNAMMRTTSRIMHL